MTTDPIKALHRASPTRTDLQPLSRPWRLGGCLFRDVSKVYRSILYSTLFIPKFCSLFISDFFCTAERISFRFWDGIWLKAIFTRDCVLKWRSRKSRENGNDLLRAQPRGFFLPEVLLPTLGTQKGTIPSPQDWLLRFTRQKLKF